MKRKTRRVSALSSVLLLLLAEPSLAADGTVLDNLKDQVISAAQDWEGTIANAAQSLFWILAGIEFGIAAVWLAVQAAALEAWVSELVRRIMFVGLFAFILTNGTQFAQAVVDSLFQIGAGGGSASPANIFNAGVEVAANLSQNAQFGLFEDNGLAIASVLAMVVVIICFSLVAAIFIAVWIEMYVGLLAGIIMLGLGGSSYTKDFAIRYLVYAFSVGMKLMALVMIARIGSQVLIGLSNNSAADDQFLATLTIAGISVVVFMISMYVPQILQSVVQGVSVSNGMEVIRHGTQTSTFAAGTAIGSAQMAAGARAAYETARNDGSSRGHAAAQAAMAPFAAFSSAAADKLSGAPHAGNASALGLANHKLKQSVPTKPQGSGSSPKSY
ncbi:P-type conjugative transfer protein TrbL [Labrenzia sp. R4_2]|uniref:P-type conjugative transfer protein TrbL n=1 Tax=Labrenzia sp. R4_2 TaxID=2821107 RepID=UPI001ADC19D5|nr:P-type conjugative transfer protein TrbL [Labrenzia sp. R4_2]MBO9422690.1 P-type conjugative transfer protein TrbL [Labrenzia sp. R4_2]